PPRRRHPPAAPRRDQLDPRGLRYPHSLTPCCPVDGRRASAQADFPARIRRPLRLVRPRLSGAHPPTSRSWNLAGGTDTQANSSTTSAESAMNWASTATQEKAATLGRSQLRS